MKKQINKIVYLTIDDAPTKNFKEKINFLYKNSIPAIFFCIGKKMKNFETDLIYAVKKGFIIGNHSFNHLYFSDLSIKNCFTEIKKTDKIIDKIYKKAGIQRPTKLFRFPYLDKGGHENSKAYENNWLKYAKLNKKQKIQGFLKELGYAQPNFKCITLKWFNKLKLLKDNDIFMTFDQMEYWLDDAHAPYGLSKEKTIMDRIDEDYPEQGRSLNYQKTSDIIMIHDMEHTNKLFFKIIKKYIKKRFIFKLPKFN